MRNTAAVKRLVECFGNVFLSNYFRKLFRPVFTVKCLPHYMSLYEYMSSLYVVLIARGALESGFEGGPLGGRIVFWDVHANLITWFCFKVGDAGKENA